MTDDNAEEKSFDERVNEIRQARQGRNVPLEPDGEPITPSVDDQFQPETLLNTGSIPPISQPDPTPADEAKQCVRDALARVEQVPAAGLSGQQQHEMLLEAIDNLQALEQELTNQTSQTDEDDEDDSEILTDDVTLELLSMAYSDNSQSEREIADRLDVSPGLVNKLLREAKGSDGDD
jgi:hypothetical protein